MSIRQPSPTRVGMASNATISLPQFMKSQCIAILRMASLKIPHRSKRGGAAPATPPGAEITAALARPDRPGIRKLAKQFNVGTGTVHRMAQARRDFFLHQQGLDTTMPAGKMMFQVLGSFAEYERDMIRARVNARIARAKAQGKHCGRPPLAFELAERIREALAVAGRPGIRVIAKQFGVSPMTVQNVARG